MSTEIKSVPNNIKFTHAEDGVINIRDGDAAFSNLLTIGALTKTAKRKFIGNASYKEYSTDTKGLDNLQSMTGEAVSHISSTIATLGQMLVYVDRQNLGDAHLGNLGWLIAGLGDVLEQLSYEHDEINHTLKKLSKQNAVNATITAKTAGAQHEKH